MYLAVGKDKMGPLNKAVHELAGSSREERRRLNEYMMAKHGLERNEVMASREATRLYGETVARGEQPDFQALYEE